MTSPFLKIGQTNASLRESGKTPSMSDLFRIETIGIKKKEENYFNNLDGMLNGPQDLEVLNA